MKMPAFMSVMRCVMTMALIGLSTALWAQQVGSVALLEGTLSATNPEGVARILVLKAPVLVGDTLSTQANSYAQITYTDGGSASLRPNSVLKIEKYHFDQTQPQSDSLVMRLIKGGLRSVTGFIGKRGNQDAYLLQTSTVYIGVRGTTGDTLDCMEDCEGVTPTSNTLEPGVYHATHTGVYELSNNGGAILVGEGQFAFANSPDRIPVLLPGDPGLGLQPFPFRVGAADPVEECRVD